MRSMVPINPMTPKLDVEVAAPVAGVLIPSTPLAGVALGTGVGVVVTP